MSFNFPPSLSLSLHKSTIPVGRIKGKKIRDKSKEATRKQIRSRTAISADVVTRLRRWTARWVTDSRLSRKKRKKSSVPLTNFNEVARAPAFLSRFVLHFQVEAGEEKIKGRSRDAVPDPVARTRESNAGGERATCRSRAPRELIIENASEIIFSTREHPTRCFLFFFSFFYFHRGQMYRVSAFRTIKRASTIVNSLSPRRLSDTRWLRCQLFTPIFLIFAYRVTCCNIWNVFHIMKIFSSTRYVT